MTSEMTPAEIQQFLQALKNSSLPTARKKHYGEKVTGAGGLSAELRAALQQELEAEIALLDQTIKELSPHEQITAAIELTENEKKEEKLLQEIDQKIRRLQEIRYQFEDKLAALDEFYDPLIEELSTAASRQKLLEEKRQKTAGLESELQKAVKQFEDEEPEEQK